MSDLEQAASRAPIITSAVGKLRSLSGNASQFGGTNGLVDAFAEVFAQMAIAAPPPAQPPESTTDANQDSGQEVPQSAESNDREQQNDSESPEAGSVEAVPGNQPLVADQHDDTLPATDSVVAEQVAVQEVQEVSEEPFSQNDGQQTEQAAVIADIEAPTEGVSATQGESDHVTDTAVVPSVDGMAEQQGRRNKTYQDGVAGEKAPNQHTELETRSKTGEIRTDLQQQDDGSDQSTNLEQQSSEPAERTERQKFLDQRRSEHRDSDDAPKQTSDGNASKRTETNAESQGVTGAVQRSSPPKAPTAPRLGTVAQVTVDAAAGANKASAKAPVGPVGGRGEAKPGTQPVQNEPGIRFDRGTGRETRPAKSDPSSTAARVKLVQRVSRAFQHLGPDGGMVRLRLAPAELGSVRIEMQISQRKVRARVIAETEAASNALREHLPDLRARLESYGMQVEQLDVETELQDQQNGSPFDQQPQQREPGQRQPRRETAHERQQLKDELLDRSEMEPLISRRPALATQGVDLRV